MIDKNLLRKFLNGQCTTEEINQVQTYFADDNSDLTTITDLLDEFWEGSAQTPADPVQVAGILNRLQSRLYPSENKTYPIPAARNTVFKRRWLVYAAAVLVLCVAGAATWQWMLSGANKTVTAIEWKTITNSGTKQQYAVLPDSSQVWLSPGANLKYAAGFTGSERAIQLTGEAYFDVRHRAAQPFVVHHGGLSTRVLGTAFNIEAYPQENTTRISLVRGKVIVNDSNSNTPMQAGELLIYDKKQRSVTKEKLTVTDPNQWTRGYAIFNDVPVTTALERIAARYNRKLILRKDIVLSKRHISTIFKNESMEEMLRLLLFVSQHSFTDNGKAITITKN